MLVPGCYTCALTFTGMNVGTHSTCCFSKYECVSFNGDSETQFRWSWRRYSLLYTVSNDLCKNERRERILRSHGPK